MQGDYDAHGNEAVGNLVHDIIGEGDCTLVHGMSGASPALVARLERVLASPFAPRIPEQGTVGASGDLTPRAPIPHAKRRSRAIVIAWMRGPAGHPTHTATRSTIT